MIPDMAWFKTDQLHKTFVNCLYYNPLNKYLCVIVIQLYSRLLRRLVFLHNVLSLQRELVLFHVMCHHWKFKKTWIGILELLPSMLGHCLFMMMEECCITGNCLVAKHHIHKKNITFIAVVSDIISYCCQFWLRDCLKL